MKNSEKNHVTCHSISQKVWVVTLPHLFPSFTMKAISSADKAKVISLCLSGHSIRKVESITGLGKWNVGRICQQLEMDKKNNKKDRPFKLSHWPEEDCWSNRHPDHKLQKHYHSKPCLFTNCQNWTEKEPLQGSSQGKKSLLKARHR